MNESRKEGIKNNEKNKTWKRKNNEKGKCERTNAEMTTNDNE